MTGLREALEHAIAGLEARAGTGEPYLYLNLGLLELQALLAAHPAEPAPVVTDEMVEAKAHVMYGFDWEHATSHVQNKYRAMVRASLEAKPAPVASRERVAEVLERALDGYAFDPDNPLGEHLSAALLAADVFRPEATVKAEALEEGAQLIEANYSPIRGDEGPSAEDEVYNHAATILRTAAAALRAGVS